MRILQRTKLDSIIHQVQFYSISLLCLIILLSVRPSVNAIRSSCPARSIVRPCACHEKQRGFDFNCDGATLNQLKEAFDSITQTGQLVYYLKIVNTKNFKLFPSYLIEGIRITHLIAYHNNLTSIEQDAFFTTTDNELLSIDLSFNQLTKVPTNAFLKLSSLIALNLNYNHIEHVADHSFTGLISLLRLSLFGNRIKQIDANAFNGIGGNLTRINLGGNLLSRVPSHCLQSLQTLNRLHLHENKIESLESDLFKNFITSDTLDTLILNNNQIKVVPDRAFKWLVGLNSLELVSNQIRDIHTEAFFQIEESLEWIKLSNNQLSDLPSSALQNLTKLRLLDLRSNSITHIRKNAFFNFGKSLKFLHLQDNRIMIIENGAFDHMQNLEWLYLSSNHLFSLSSKLFEPIILSQKLKVLDIHDNPFICNCELSWLVDYIDKEGSSVVNLPKQTKCKLSILKVFEKFDQDNHLPLISDLENYSKKLNISLQSLTKHHHNYLKTIDKMDEKSKANQLDKEVPLNEMNKCSSSTRSTTVNYRYHLYCLVLSFIMVHIIYYYLGFLFL